MTSLSLAANEQKKTNKETIAKIVVVDLQVTEPTLSASCEGLSDLPNLIGLEIAVGREVMFENGYTPVINQDFSNSWESKYYPRISELMGCSNGVPWCVFNYENDVSVAILRTLGNQEIVEQEVICDTKKAD